MPALFEPFGAFPLAEETTDWFRAWTGNSELDGASCRVFGQDGSGSMGRSVCVTCGHRVIVCLHTPMISDGRAVDEGAFVAEEKNGEWCDVLLGTHSSGRHLAQEAPLDLRIGRHGGTPQRGVDESGQPDNGKGRIRSPIPEWKALLDGLVRSPGRGGP
ncbi:hypothetical protein [Actinacidiphila yanglinensis]|uniref:hypothetical protein n=1 Tax=Actinacidiphila yanglinensis TaxID=310779 RepID=UPI001F2844E4|nr:hypothetical protein [Actinacidiphila yanglinensis]